MGRKAWLFCNTADGAKASAVIYSIVETAKANGLKPYIYLSHILEVMPRHMKDNSLSLLKTFFLGRIRFLNNAN